MLGSNGKLTRGGSPCRHCGQKPGWKARGLCVECYDRLRGLGALDALYPPNSTVSSWHGDNGLQHKHLDESEEWDRSAPPLPTDALPGSPLKVEVMEIRYSLGFSLFHPLDRTGIEQD